MPPSVYWGPDKNHGSVTVNFETKYRTEQEIEYLQKGLRIIKNVCLFLY